MANTLSERAKNQLRTHFASSDYLQSVDLIIKDLQEIKNWGVLGLNLLREHVPSLWHYIVAVAYDGVGPGLDHNYTLMYQQPALAVISPLQLTEHWAIKQSVSKIPTFQGSGVDLKDFKVLATDQLQWYRLAAHDDLAKTHGLKSVPCQPQVSGKPRYYPHARLDDTATLDGKSYVVVKVESDGTVWWGRSQGGKGQICCPPTETHMGDLTRSWDPYVNPLTAHRNRQERICRKKILKDNAEARLTHEYMERAVRWAQSVLGPQGKLSVKQEGPGAYTLVASVVGDDRSVCITLFHLPDSVDIQDCARRLLELENE